MGGSAVLSIRNYWAEIEGKITLAAFDHDLDLSFLNIVIGKIRAIV